MGAYIACKMPWMMYLWPGLPQMWKHGSWLGLAMAVGFALLVNLALMSSIIWSELTTSGMRIVAWLLVGSFWIISAMAAYGWQREQTNRRQGERRQKEYEVPLAEGLQYYLQNNWFEAERVFRRLLRRNCRDADSRLMLAALLRHTKRYEEAQIQLDRLRLTEGSRKWELEIEQEQRLLDQLKSDEQAPGNEQAPENTDSDEVGLEEETRTHEGQEEPSVEDRQAA